MKLQAWIGLYILADCRLKSSNRIFCSTAGDCRSMWRTYQHYLLPYLSLRLKSSHLICVHFFYRQRSLYDRLWSFCPSTRRPMWHNPCNSLQVNIGLYICLQTVRDSNFARRSHQTEFKTAASIALSFIQSTWSIAGLKIVLNSYSSADRTRAWHQIIKYDIYYITRQNRLHDDAEYGANYSATYLRS